MSLVALTAALAFVVWAFVLLRWGSVLAVSMVLLIAGTVFGPSFLHFDGPFQISSERVLFGAMVPFFIIHRRLGWTDPKPFCRGDWLLAAFTVYLAYSSQVGGSNSVGGSTLARWLFYVALPTGMYVMARGSHIGKRDLWWVATAMLGLAAYLAVVSCMEARGLQQFVFPRYIVDPKMWEFYGRGRGPLLNPSANGILMTAGLAVAISRWYEPGRIGKLFYGLLVILLLAGCYHTLTRIVWIGAAGVLGMLVFFRLSRTMQIWAITAAVFVGGIGVPTVGKSLLKLKRDKDLSAEASLQSIQLRPLLAVIALEMWKDKPVTGHGYGHYLDNNKPYAEARHWDMPLETASRYVQHNILLSLLADTGLVGVGLFMGLLGWWSIVAWQLYQRYANVPEIRTMSELLMGTLVAYFANGMVQDATIFPMIHMFLLTFAGIATGIHIRGGLASPIRVVTTHHYEPHGRATAQYQH